MTENGRVISTNAPRYKWGGYHNSVDAPATMELPYLETR